jgi:hypothetical protein
MPRLRPCSATGAPPSTAGGRSSRSAVAAMTRGHAYRHVALPCGLFLLALDTLVDLLAMHRDVARGVDADAHLIALDAKDGHGDLVADHQRFPDPAGEYEHGRSPVAVR